MRPQPRSTPPAFGVAFVLASLSLVVAACGASTAATTTTALSTTAPPPDTVPLETTPPTTIPSDDGGFRSQPTACDATAPPPNQTMSFDAPQDMGLDPAQPVTAVIATSCGDITVELDPGSSPQTVNSFVFLAEQGYFDGTVSHRIVPGFVVQAGDPTATGLGGPGYVIPDEYPEQGFLYERGVVAMANAGPGTTGSQFFIMIDDAGLPPTFSVLGQVVDGFEALDRIAAIPLTTSPSGEPSLPLETLYLNQIRVQR